MPCSRARSRTTIRLSPSSVATPTGSRCRSIMPASIFDRSSTSLITASRCLPLERMLLANSSCCVVSLPAMPLRSTSEKPLIAFSGVRSSCDILARKADFMRLPRPARRSGARSRGSTPPAWRSGGRFHGSSFQVGGVAAQLLVQVADLLLARLQLAVDQHRLLIGRHQQVEDLLALRIDQVFAPVQVQHDPLAGGRRRRLAGAGAGWPAPARCGSSGRPSHTACG